MRRKRPGRVWVCRLCNPEYGGTMNAFYAEFCINCNGTRPRRKAKPAAPYEAPIVTPVGNLLDDLARVCPPKGDS